MLWTAGKETLMTLLEQETANELPAAKLAVHKMIESARYAEQGMWMEWMVIRNLIEMGALTPKNDPALAKVYEPEISRAKEVTHAILEEVRELPSWDQRSALAAFILEMVRCTATRETQKPLANC